MGKSKILPTSRINIKNKRAEHDYLVIDKYTAGTVSYTHLTLPTIYSV